MFICSGCQQKETIAYLHLQIEVLAGFTQSYIDKEVKVCTTEGKKGSFKVINMYVFRSNLNQIELTCRNLIT